MEKKELTEALELHQKAIEDKMAELQKAADEKAVELKKEVSEMEAKRAEMQKQLDQLDVEMQKKNTPSAETKNYIEQLREKLDSEIKNLAQMKGVGASQLKLQVKSFLETANASVTTGSLIPWPQRDPGVSKAPDRAPFMLDLVARGMSNSLTIYWAQRKTRTDNSEWVDEGVAPAAQTILGYETKNQAMQNLSSFIKISNNSIDDIDFIMSEVQTELVTLHLLKLDAAILNGTVAGNGFDGVNTVATAFAAGGDALPSGVTPNKFDVLAYAINQVRVAHFEPNYIVMHPSDVRDMKLTRDDQGAYMIPPTMATGMNVAVDGIRIVANTGVTKGSYLVGDFTKAKYWTRKDMELRIWEQNDDDATAQLKTVTLYTRGTLVVKDADKLAFVKDTFADSITEITAV